MGPRIYATRCDRGRPEEGSVKGIRSQHTHARVHRVLFLSRGVKTYWSARDLVVSEDRIAYLAGLEEVGLRHGNVGSHCDYMVISACYRCVLGQELGERRDGMAGKGKRVRAVVVRSTGAARRQSEGDRYGSKEHRRDRYQDPSRETKSTWDIRTETR